MEGKNGYGLVAKDDADQVRAHTDPPLQERIDRETEERVRFYATQPEEIISCHMDEPEHEWDIERVLEISASALAFTGIVLGVTVDRKQLWLSGGVVLPFLFHHAVQGWCPPVSVFRRMGVCTRRQIDAEKFALEALRGDFDLVPVEHEPDPRTRPRGVAGSEGAGRHRDRRRAPVAAVGSARASSLPCSAAYELAVR